MTENGSRQPSRDTSTHTWSLQGADSDILVGSLCEERDALLTLLDNAPESGLVYLDSEFRFVYANPTYVRSSGHTWDELVGRNHFEVFPNAENQAIFERARDTGQPAVFRAKPFEYEDQPWRGVTYWDWTLTPVKSEEGTVRGFVFSLVEVTDSVLRHQMSDALSRIDRLIHSTLDFDEIMRLLVEGAVDTARVESGSIALRVEGGWQARYVHRMPESYRLVRTLSAEEMPVAEAAVASRGVVAVDDVSVANTEVREALQPFGIKSILDVPLFVADEVVGVLALVHYTDPIGFSDIVGDFAARVGASASLALSNARLYEEEHKVAEAMRLALTRPTPDVPSLAIGVVHRPAWEAERVGGDFYDVFELDDGKVALLIGDVSGKGVRAAALTETTRSAVRTLTYLDPQPALVMTRLNASLLRELEPGTFVTAILAVIEPVTGHVELACSGHPPPVLCARKPGFVEVNAGVVLGAFEAEYEQTSFEIGNDTLLLFTDGVTEVRRNGLLFGHGRLLRAIGTCGLEPQELVDRVLAEITSFGRGILPDDVAMLAVRRRRVSKTAAEGSSAGSSEG